MLEVRLTLMLGIITSMLSYGIGLSVSTMLDAAIANHRETTLWEIGIACCITYAVLIPLLITLYFLYRFGRRYFYLYTANAAMVRRFRTEHIAYVIPLSLTIAAYPCGVFWYAAQELWVIWLTFIGLPWVMQFLDTFDQRLSLEPGAS